MGSFVFKDICSVLGAFGLFSEREGKGNPQISLTLSYTEIPPGRLGSQDLLWRFHEWNVENLWHDLHSLGRESQAHGTNITPLEQQNLSLAAGGGKGAQPLTLVWGKAPTFELCHIPRAGAGWETTSLNRRPQCGSSRRAWISPCDFQQHQVPSGHSAGFNSWIISCLISSQPLGWRQCSACLHTLLISAEFGIKTVLLLGRWKYLQMPPENISIYWGRKKFPILFNRLVGRSSSTACKGIAIKLSRWGIFTAQDLFFFWWGGEKNHWFGNSFSWENTHLSRGFLCKQRGHWQCVTGRGGQEGEGEKISSGHLFRV